jgi:hypothetical protein
MLTLRWRLKDLRVLATEQPFDSGGLEVPPGSFVIPTAQPGKDVAALVRAQAEPLGLPVTGMPLPDGPMHEVDLPRVAIYSTWGSTQEVGWVRHAFDQFELPFDLIYKERVRQGDLRAAYDVIVVPNQGRGSGKGLVYDIEPRGKPLDYRKSDAFRSLGAYGESDDITGGMGLEGVVEFEKFVRAGGVLVTLAGASYFPAEFGLTRTVNAQRPSSGFYAPGPIVQAEILKPRHPILYGYADKNVPVRYGNGPLLQVPSAERDQLVLMRYPGGASGVLSGLMRGPDEIRNRPAIVDVPVGQGRIVLFAGNPCYRWQNHGEFGMLFNGVLHWNDLGAGAKKADTPTAAAAR